MNKNSLENIAQTILGSYYYDKFRGYYNNIFSHAGEWDYIAFVTRRAFRLALIFKEILDPAIPEKTQLITDNALLSYTEQIGKTLESERPDVLIVDDLVSYGRTINTLLYNFESRLQQAYYEHTTNEYDRTFAGKYLRAHVSVCVFAEKDQKNFLIDKEYRTLINNANLSEKGVYKPDIIPQTEWNGISCRMSELISCSGIANAGFVITAGTNHKLNIDSDPTQPAFQTPAGWIREDSEYRGVKQSVYFLDNRDIRYNAICTVRCMRSGTGPEYRLIPFVFLPQLTLEKLEELEDILCKNINVRDFTLKSRYEFVTMYLGQIILRQFAEDAGITDLAYDWEKAIWNYRFGEDYCNKIKDICDPGKRIPSVRDLIVWVKNLELPELGRIAGLFPSRFRYTTGEKLNEQDRDKLNFCIENCLFDRTIDTEARSYSMARQEENRFISFSIGLNRNREQNDIEYFIAEDLYAYYYKKSYDGKYSENAPVYFSLTQTVAAILQMMDAGLMAVVICVGNRKISQNIKDCEQAMAAFPERYYCHLDALMELDLPYSIGEWDIRVGLRKYIEDLSIEMRNNPRCDCTVKETPEELLRYLKQLRYASQRVYYWNIDMDLHYVIGKDGQLMTYTEYMRKEKNIPAVVRYTKYDYRMLRMMFRKTWENTDK